MSHIEKFLTITDLPLSLGLYRVIKQEWCKNKRLVRLFEQLIVETVKRMRL